MEIFTPLSFGLVVFWPGWLLSRPALLPLPAAQAVAQLPTPLRAGPFSSPAWAYSATAQQLTARKPESLALPR